MMYDLSELKLYSRGNRTFELEMIQIFLEEAPSFINQVKKYTEDKDYNSLRLLAHKYKSSIDVLGMGELRKALDVIEKQEECKILEVLPKLEIMIVELVDKLNLEKDLYKDL